MLMHLHCDTDCPWSFNLEHLLSKLVFVSSILHIIQPDVVNIIVAAVTPNGQVAKA